jgi:CRISPR-associated protein Cas2
MERNFYVIVYDIPDDKRRTKIAKALEALGERAQYSVFEVYLTPPEMDALEKKLKKMMKENEDAVRIYLLCGTCRERVHSLGQGQVSAPPGLVIV